MRRLLALFFVIAAEAACLFGLYAAISSGAIETRRMSLDFSTDPVLFVAFLAIYPLMMAIIPFAAIGRIQEREGMDTHIRRKVNLPPFEEPAFRSEFISDGKSNRYN